MKRYIVSLLLISILLSGCDTQEVSRVCFDDDCFYVEVVDRPDTRAKGLMYRESMDHDKGMLFVFENEGVYDFWMKNTLIPLDMIWIGSNMTVSYVKNDAQPCKADPCPHIKPEGRAKYVLEVNSGRAKQLNIMPGDSVTFDLKK